MKAQKRWRAPKAKEGELKVAYGRSEGETALFYCYGGEGARSCDARLLSGVFEREKVFGSDNTLVQELEARGYDITTLKLTIQQSKTE